ncbi:hypothetical protein KCU74_g88, partial [Aureobasidium melanogenum]
MPIFLSTTMNFEWNMGGGCSCQCTLFPIPFGGFRQPVCDFRILIQCVEIVAYLFDVSSVVHDFHDCSDESRSIGVHPVVCCKQNLLVCSCNQIGLWTSQPRYYGQRTCSCGTNQGGTAASHERIIFFAASPGDSEGFSASACETLDIFVRGVC